MGGLSFFRRRCCYCRNEENVGGSHGERTAHSQIKIDTAEQGSPLHVQSDLEWPLFSVYISKVSQS